VPTLLAGETVMIMTTSIGDQWETEFTEEMLLNPFSVCSKFLRIKGLKGLECRRPFSVTLQSPLPPDIKDSQSRYQARNSRKGPVP